MLRPNPIVPTGLGRIYIVCGGTRGDQQPMIMVGVQLKQMGYKICMCIGPEGKAWVDAYGFETMELASFKKTMTETKGVITAGETGNFQTLMASVAPALGETLPKEVSGLYDRMKDDPEAVGIVVTSTHFQLSEVIARRFEIYGMSIFFSPFSPTVEFPAYQIDTRNPSTWQAIPGMEKMATYPGGDTNRRMWEALLTSWATQYSPLLGLCATLCEATDEVPQGDDGLTLLANMIGCKKPSEGKPETIPVTDTLFAYSQQLVGAGGPKDFTWEQRRAQVGYVFENNAQVQTSLSPFGEDIQAFLKRGSSPVYFGWGSMIREKNHELIHAAVSACKKGNWRGVILGGWAHLNLEMLDAERDADLIKYAQEHVFVCETVDHTKLFPQCSCLVTHGGMGTTAAMLRSGRPCIVTPVWWDQNFSGDRVEALGVGRRGPHFAKVDGDNLADLIREVTTQPRFAQAAKRIGDAIAQEAPAEVTIATRIHQGIQKKNVVSGKGGCNCRCQ